MFLDTDGKTFTVRIRYITLPLEFIDWHGELSIEALETFVARVLPVEDRYRLLEFFGLMVMKCSQQRSLGLVVDLNVGNVALDHMAQTLRAKLKNKKSIWFCRTELISEAHRKALGFWEIKGTGHSISGVPGYDRRGKVDVWIQE